ncbi:MAG: hypothetical protein PHG36_09315 [Dehalococcoidia bacterium]|nr:hypothetical protein [Dehalococcoidia bacterium]
MQTISAEKSGKPLRKHRILRWSMMGMLAYSAIVCPDNTKSRYVNGNKPASFYDSKNKGDFQVSHLIRSPLINGGPGVRIFEHGAQALNYSGAFMRPWVVKPTWDDLMVGAQPIAQNDLNETGGQENSAWDPALWIMKLAAKKMAGLPTFRIADERQGIQYILTTQWQRYQDQDYPGGYLAFHDKKLMVTGGGDGQQWRSALGYVAPDQGDEHLRPAMEGFYVDNSRGKINGGKDLMVSGSLGFRKGFLGHVSRLGRATGPTGGEFTNSLSYFNPDFNRRLTAWEIGELVDFRFLHKTLANGWHEKTLETALYPGQLLGKKSQLDPLFVGVGVTRSQPGKDEISALFGYHQQLGNFGSSARVQHDFDRNDTSWIVSLIHRL